MIFRVWAPKAKTVELLLESQAHAMTAKDQGWWELEMYAAPGTRYQYVVNGQGPFPDPRSSWQPEGLHAPSEVVDHSFPWKDDFVPKPLSEAVIYELHIGTFTEAGTYSAAEEKLQYLSELGITHLEIMPLATFPGERGWGYDGAALYAPHPCYGTPAQLKHFIQEAHNRKLAVLLDVVYNHLGPDGNYLGAFGPYFTDLVKTPWGDAINFDGEYSDVVRQFFIENALMWLREYRFDGLRLDAVHAIIDHGATHFLEELGTRVNQLSEELGRQLVVIAESDINTPRLVQPVTRGGYGLDAHWEDDFHHAVHAFLTGETSGFHTDFGSLSQVAKSLEQAYVFDGQYSKFRKRKHGRPPVGIGANQIVVFVQNHDQTGNRAMGERLSHLLDSSRLKAAAALLLLSPFVPMLFQGEEWGASTPFLFFTDHTEELGRLVTEGRRKEFGAFDWADKQVPDPQSRESFERSKLRWNEPLQSHHREILEWHEKLIRLRRAIPQRTPAEIQYDENSRWLTLKRHNVLAIFNFSDRAQSIPIPPGAWKNIPSTARFEAFSTSIFTT